MTGLMSVAACLSRLLLLLSGDVELNPGPKKGGGEKGSSADDKIKELGSALSEYEGKIQDLEKEIKSQRESYDRKLDDLATQLKEVIERSQDQVRRDDLELMRTSLEEKMTTSVEEGLQRSQKSQEDFEELQKAVMEQQANAQERIAAIESHIQEFRQMSEENVHGVMSDTETIKANYTSMEQKIKDVKTEATGKLQALTTSSKDQRREYKSKFLDMDVEFQRMKERLETIHMILDDIQEKMYEFEQNKKNNLILYGVVAKHPEASDSLRQKIGNIFRDHLNIRRDVAIQKATRVHTGPEVRGCRPVLVTFETFKDRETVLRLAKVLNKKAHIHVTEDLSKRTREARQELRKFMRQVKRQNPERSCFLEYDKLYIDHRPYIWNEILGQVVEATEAQKFNFGELMMSRPGTQMGPYNGIQIPFTASRPPSGMSLSASNNRSLDSVQIQHPKSASGIPRLPPLSRATSLASGMSQMFDPREEKINEMERMLTSYQEKLDSVTTNYEEKVSMLETRLVDREMEQAPGSGDYGDLTDSMDRDRDCGSPKFTPQGQQFLTSNYQSSPTKSYNPGGGVNAVDEITAAADYPPRHQSSPTKAAMPPIILEEREEDLNQLGSPKNGLGTNGYVDVKERVKFVNGHADGPNDNLEHAGTEEGQR